MPRVSIQNLHFKGGHTGIKAGPGVEIDAQGLTFDNVLKPFDLDPSVRLTLGGSRVVNDPKIRPPAETSHSTSRTSEQRNAFVGWTRPDGPPLPSFCPDCNSVFPSANYVFGGAYFRSWGNTEQCPHCGRSNAYLSEGVFDLSRDVVRVISAPDMTHAMLQALVALAEESINAEVAPDDIARRLEAISPNLGVLAKKALKIGFGVVTFVSAIAGIYSLYLDAVQTDIAREQLRLDRESAAHDRALETALARYADLLTEALEQQQQARAREKAARPSEDR